jgi:mercuric ion transport protein
MKIPQVTTKLGDFGVIVSAMGCASCFPLLGSLGTAVGLGFLAGFEGVFLNTLLPAFAILALASSIFSWVQHRQLVRGVLGVMGPIMVLATFYLFWTDNWSTYLFYFALALMLTVAIWDILSPPTKACAAPQPSEERA